MHYRIAQHQFHSLNVPAQLVSIAQVAFSVHIHDHTQLKRFGHQTKGIKVYAAHIQAECGAGDGLVYRGIHAAVHTQQSVVALHVQFGTPLLEQGIGPQAVQIPSAVPEMFHPCLGFQAGAGR